MPDTMPTERVYPHDLDLDAIAQRDSEAVPILASLIEDMTALDKVPDPEVLTLLHAASDRHALLTELYTARRDRDSARATVLAVSSVVPRWRKAEAEYPNEFKRGLGAAAETLADILARQMTRD